MRSESKIFLCLFPLKFFSSKSMQSSRKPSQLEFVECKTVKSGRSGETVLLD